MHRSLLRAAAALVTFLAATPLAHAQRVLIDFAEFRSDYTTTYQATPGGDVYSKGFNFVAGSNSLLTWGTDPSDPMHGSVPTNLGPTAAALGAETFGDNIDMYVAPTDKATDDNSGRGRFNLFSMQAAHMFSSDYLTTPPNGSEPSLNLIRFLAFGWTTPGGFGTSSYGIFFNIAVPPRIGGVQSPVLTTLLFPSQWRNLTRVRFYNASFNPTTGGRDSGSGLSSQFTNIDAEIVPEPSTYLLLGSGLVVLLVVARRRQAMR